MAKQNDDAEHKITTRPIDAYNNHGVGGGAGGIMQ